MRRSLRRKVKLNPWGLLRPWCLVVGHDEEPVVPGDAWSNGYMLCRRCLRERT